MPCAAFPLQIPLLAAVQAAEPEQGLQLEVSAARGQAMAPQPPCHTPASPTPRRTSCELRAFLKLQIAN